MAEAKAEKIASQLEAIQKESIHLPTWKFNPKKDQWMIDETITERSRIKTGSLRMVSYNVFFFQNFAGEIRHPVLLEIVRKSDADVIGFQEVTLGFLRLILACPWIREHYYISDGPNGQTILPYGCMLLSRIPPVKFYRNQFPTNMARSLIAAEFFINNRTFRVGTVHLESYRMDTPYRKEQLIISCESIGQASDGILMGDYNMRDSFNENHFVSPNFKDCYRTLYPEGDTPEGNGFTFDFQENLMLRDTGTMETGRLDRINLKSDDDMWVPVQVEIIGREEIETKDLDPKMKEFIPKVSTGHCAKLWPSDHFGLIATFEWKGDAVAPDDQFTPGKGGKEEKSPGILQKFGKLFK
eukprot:TRINITY_DN3721_c0_g1_i1.p1 TRINITY_DN3721_c0_g1~~TRINITY_DN3721_c0_g1_i1.p1  ORF type:complete len:355 (-),score=90.53 TRINITY_DN3721_c0_g1_i1:43-1107(-)